MNAVSRRVALTAVLVSFGSVLSGCSTATHTEVTKPGPVAFQVRNVPGVVEYVWVEPQVEVVDVAPGIDADGYYYNRGHQAVSEVKQGRWVPYRQPAN